MQFVRKIIQKLKNTPDMKEEKVYNEGVKDAGKATSGNGNPSHEEAGDANMADRAAEASAKMAEDELAAADADSAKEEKDGDKGASDATAKAVEEAVAEWKDRFLRLQAEFDNYRKRTLKEKMDLVQTGGRDVLLAMLPVRDDVQRAMAAMEKSDDLEALRSGVRLISQKFTDALRQKGVTEMELKEKEFDADIAEAVAKFAAGEELKGKVIDVVQTGYMLGDKVLRFAKVVVGE